MIADLNRLYTGQPALHEHDFEQQGFEWIDCHDASQSVLSYLRKNQQGLLITVLNFTPVPRHNYRLGVPRNGFYHELLNSDSAYYGGSNVGNDGGVVAVDKEWMGRPYSITLNLPPLGGLVLEYKGY